MRLALDKHPGLPGLCETETERHPAETQRDREPSKLSHLGPGSHLFGGGGE